MENGVEFFNYAAEGLYVGQVIQVGPDAPPAVGNVLPLGKIPEGTMNIVNGHVTAFIVDDDPKGRAMKGLLGFQIHVGDPMKIEFRNVYLKSL